MLKRILLALVILAALVIGGLWMLRNRAAAMLMEFVSAAAAKQGVSIQTRESSLGFSGLGLREVSIQGVMNRVPTSLQVDELNIYFSPWALMSRSFYGRISGRLYHGTMDIKLNVDARNKTGTLEVELERVELAEHPILRTLGIERGQLTVRVPSLKLERHGFSGPFSVELVKLRKLTESKWTWGVPAPITVPSFDKFSLLMEGGLSSSTMIVRSMSSDSDFGTMSGKVTVEQNRAIDASGEVQLTPRGTEVIGPWLPVLSRNALQPSVTQFKFAVSGAPDRPQLRMTPR